MTTPPRDPILLVLRRWYVVAVAALVAFAGASLYYVYAQHLYEARLSVVPVERRASKAGGQLAAAARLLELDVTDLLGSTTTDRIAAVLHSRSVTDEVIAKLGLETHYGTAHIEQARIALWTRCHTNVDRKGELVELVCRDSEPELAARLASSIAEVGGDVFRRISVTSATERRRFLDTEVREARTRADSAASALRAFQEQHHVVDPEAQAQAVIATIVELHAQRISKELELAYQESFAAPTEARSVQLRRQLDAIDQQLVKQVGVPPTEGSASAGIFPAAMELPALILELRKLTREQKLREAMFVSLSQQLELARAEEALEPATFATLDAPTRTTSPVWPTWRVLVLSPLVGILVGLLAVLVPAWWRGLRARIAAEEAGTTNQ